MSQQPQHIYEFGPFRLDTAERLLLREGQTVPLATKAVDLWLALVGRHGHVKEKDGLLKTVWPDTFVDESNLSSNISQLRKALGDGENGQRFIETAPKRGYRFVASVKKVVNEHAELMIQEQPGSDSAASEVEQATNAGELITTHPAVKADKLLSKADRYRRGALLALGALILLGGIFAYVVLRPPPPPKVTASAQITRDGLPKVYTSFTFSSNSLVTDGPRLFFSEIVNGHWVVAQAPSTEGEAVTIPAFFPAAFLRDISTSRSELLVESGPGSDFESPLWVLPVLGGAPRRVGNVMSHAASWSLDGRQIVYANGSTLYLAKSDGTESRILAPIPGRPYWPRWSPDGRRLRFSVGDTSLSRLNSLWEVAADGSNPHPLLSSWNNPAAECCGNWTPDGRYFVFQSTRNGTTNIWAIREPTGLFRSGDQTPVQLTF